MLIHYFLKQNETINRISGFHSGKYECVALCSLVEIYHHFRGACCLQPDDGGSKYQQGV